MNLVDDVWMQRYEDSRQRAWLRVSAYAEAHTRPNGHCPLTAGELGRVLDLDAQQVSRAIRLATSEGWLHPASSARCLVLALAEANARCPAIHRDGR